jgi:hypothetical protein
MAATLLGIGAFSLNNKHIVRVDGLAATSRQALGAGLGVACKTMLSYGGGSGTMEVRTDGPCNPDPVPDLSDVRVCNRIGHPTDVGLCDSLVAAVTLTAIGGSMLLATLAFYVVLAWKNRTCYSNSTANKQDSV